MAEPAAIYVGKHVVVEGALFVTIVDSGVKEVFDSEEVAHIEIVWMVKDLIRYAVGDG